MNMHFIAAASAGQIARVQIGSYRAIVRGPDFENIPLDEQLDEPVYAYTHEQIDRDCDSHARWPASCASDVEERRARLHRQLDQASVVKTPSIGELLTAERIAFEEHSAACKASDCVELGREATDEEEAATDAASRRQWDALQAVFSHPPTCPADIVAMLDLFDEREMQSVPSPVDDFLTNLFCSARVYLDPDKCSEERDPIDLLWAEWHEKTVNFSAHTLRMSEDEADRFYDGLAHLERRIEVSAPSSMRAAAAALCELWHETSDEDETRTVGGLIATEMRNDLGRVTVVVLQSLRPSLSGFIRQVVDDLCDRPEQRFSDSLLQRQSAPAVLLQAAE